jgi:GNAT superfamily N-acetyltransferase
MSEVPDARGDLMSEVTVRLVDGDDWELWRDLRLRALRDAPTAFGSTYERELGFGEADWRRRLSDDAPAVVAFVDGRPAGMGGGYSDLPGWLHVVAMWTDPAVRGRGVGGAVLAALVGWAGSHGLRTHLDVTVGNDAARRTYERAGFVATGEVRPLREGSPDVIERMVLAEPADVTGVSGRR